MEFVRLDLDGLILVKPRRITDDRGFFSETFRHDLFEEAAGGPIRFVQDNHSWSARRGTLRGLHYQAPPMAQGKLVRVSRGAVVDVAVDLRSDSPTCGRHVAVELSAENGHQLWVPPGFAHGFCTLTDDVDFLYKVTAYYSADHDGAIAWNDPDFAIAWPFSVDEIEISPRDCAAGRWRDLPALF